jgi:GTP-binding protein
MLPRAAFARASSAAAALLGRAGGRRGGEGSSSSSCATTALLFARALFPDAYDRSISTAPITPSFLFRPLSTHAPDEDDEDASSRRRRRAALVLSGQVAPLSQKARFVDSLHLEAVGGQGGGGSSALFGRKGVHPRAAGGHGGRGGDVILRAAGGGGGGQGGAGRLRGLGAVPRRAVGGAGNSGGKQWKQGAAGRAAVVEVPVGTRVWELVPDLKGAADEEEEGEEGDDEEDEEQGSDDEAAAEDADDEAFPEEDEDEEAQEDGQDDPYLHDDAFLDPPLPAGDALVRLLTSGAVPLPPELKARLWTERRLPLALFSSSPSSSSSADNDIDTSSTSTTLVSFTRVQALEALEAQAPLMAELQRPGEELVVSRGGRGGRGSAGRPSKPHGPASRQRDAGKPGQRALLLLRTRLLADVALVGAPNAGKSSLLRALCGARAEVGAHAVTTLRPQLGALPRRGELPAGLLLLGSRGEDHEGAKKDEDDGDDAGDEGPAVTLADVPGLLEGAHAGRGRGIAFLAPLQRASVLAFVVDLSGGGGGDGDADDAHEEEEEEAAATTTAAVTGGGLVPDPPARQLRVLIDEVRRFDPELLGIVEEEGDQQQEGRAAAIVVANKTDAVVGGLKGAREALRALAAAAPRGWPIVPVSALEGAGLPALAEALRALVLKQRRRRRDEGED